MQMLAHPHPIEPSRLAVKGIIGHCLHQFQMWNQKCTKFVAE